jgi:ribosomal protein S18 acetylase RimI-like enzyme
MITGFRLEKPDGGDEPFLRRLILDTISLELGADQWPEPMRGQLLDIQVSGRSAVRGRNPDGESRILLLDGEPAGWLFLLAYPEELRIEEVMVAPEHRRKGLARAAIEEVLRQATRDSRPVRLNVNTGNGAAIRLYESLGFRRTGGDQIQHQMEAR